MTALSEADELFGEWVDPEPKRVVCWWGKDFTGDGFTTTDPAGCTFLVKPMYLPNSIEKWWSVAWSDGPYLSVSSYLYETAEKAMNMVDLHLAHAA